MLNSEDTIISADSENNIPFVKRETLDMILAQLDSGNDISNKLTSNHIDTILAQRGDILSYINSDRKRESKDKKFVLVTLLLFTLIILGGVSYFHPDLLGEVISLFVGLLGGYGFGKSNES